MERQKLISLVTAAQAGKSDAISDLFNAFYNDVYFFALKTCCDEDIACEVTQETFIEIINTIGSLKEPAAFVTWMKQIAYHQCTRFFKKQKSHNKYETLADENEDGVSVFDFAAEDREEFIPDEAVDQKEFRQTILSMLDQLSPEHRSALMLYYYDELSVKQIAQIQEVSESAVKSRLFHGRKQLKNAVETYEKKNSVKLHCVGMFPLFTWLFQGGETLSVLALPGVVGAITASTGAAIVLTGTGVVAATGVAGTGFAAFWATIPAAVKIIAATVALTVTVGGGAMVIFSQSAPESTQPTEQVMATMSATDAATTPSSGETTPEDTSAVETQPTEPVTEPTRATDPKETDPAETTSSITEPTESATSETTVPETEPSETTVPTETMPPETTTPETQPPETTAPETEPSESTVPTETMPPETTTPETQPPETTAPETEPSESTVPTETTPPEITTPETQPPETTVPETTPPTTEPSVSGYTVPNGCTYTTADGTTYQSGKTVPNCTAGDTLTTADYIYTYSTGGWAVVVRDNSKSSYGVLLGEINGKPLTSMSSAFHGCSAMVQAPAIPTSVTNMASTFSNCAKLTTAPVIPYGVTDMTSTFYNCYNLKKAPIIPASVTNMTNTFFNCQELTDPPEIPASVTTMDSTFSRCHKLTRAPVIPYGVTDMSSTFYECKKITEPPVIPDSVTDMYSTFYGCSAMTYAPTIPDGVTDMAYTFFGCRALTTAPVISANVTDIRYTFASCVNLTGTVVINSTLTSSRYGHCFENTVLPITLIGNSQSLSEIAGTATNGNVTVG